MRTPRYAATVHYVGEQRVLALNTIDDSGPTITNGAELVIADLKARGSLQPGDRVIYVDTEGQWDELCIDENGFVGFRMLGAGELEDALARLPT